MENKRHDPFWMLPGTRRSLPAGTEIKEVQVPPGMKHIMLVNFPPDTTYEEVERMGQMLRKLASEEQLVVLVPQGVDIKFIPVPQEESHG